MTAAMFSVSVDASADPPLWRATCDRCGQTLDMSGREPLLVVKVPHLEELAVVDMPRVEELAKSIRRALEGDMAMFDASWEVQSIPRGGIGERLLAHAERCECTEAVR